MSNNPTNYYNILKLLNADVTKDWVYYVKTYCSAKQIYIKTERDKVSNAYIRKKGKKTWYDLDYAERMELNDILDKSCRKIWIMGEPSNLDELQERTKHLYYRIVNDSSEIKKIVQMIDYNLDSFEQKVYDDAWDSYVEKQTAEGKSTKIDTKQLIETSLLRQVTAQLMIPHTSVIVKQYVANGDKVIIFCNFDKEVQAFKEEFGDLAVIYNGKMSIKEKDASVKRFMEDDDCMVFIGNIEAAGVGLTLIKSHVIVFNSVSWVPASNNQAEYRILRIGQTEDCVIIYQKFNNTYHDRIFEILDIKNKTIDAVIVSENEK